MYAHYKLTIPQFDSAQAAYRRVLDRDPNHAKVLQQLGWLYHQQSNSYASQEKAIEYLEKSVSAGKFLAHTLYPEQALTSLASFRQQRRTKLVPSWSLLHVASQVSQGL
jgi:tetratricopeptide (TPR) repeat protein